MSTSPLFQTYQWGGHSLQNRMALAPLTRGRAGTHRIPNELMAEYYYQRAGAGLIISEATSISEEALGWVDSPGVYSGEMVEGWKKSHIKTKADRHTDGSTTMALRTRIAQRLPQRRTTRFRLRRENPRR